MSECEVESLKACEGILCPCRLFCVYLRFSLVYIQIEEGGKL
jgi:hypothetical protein